MDAELVTLINSGATTLLGLMVTDTWEKIKGLALKIFGRNGVEGSIVDRDMEDTRIRLKAALESGDPTMSKELEAEWRSRIRRAVSEDEENAGALQSFLEECGPLLGARSMNTAAQISMSAEAYGNSTVYQQGQGTQYNS